MKTYQIFLYDKHVRTNYIELVEQAENQLDFYANLKQNKDLVIEITRKFRYAKKLDDIINGNFYEINIL